MKRIVIIDNGKRTIVADYLTSIAEVLENLIKLKLWDWALENDPNYIVPDFTETTFASEISKILKEANQSWSWYHVVVELYHPETKEVLNTLG